MPTKGTKILSARVREEDIEIIKQRAKRRKLTVNAWLNWSIKNGLRNHRRKR